MLNSIYRALIHRRNLSVHNKICCVQFNHFSSKAANQDSVTVNYLINTFGFSKEKAFTVSKYMKVSSTEKSDSVVALFKSHGLTKQQVDTMVKNFPPIILYSPEKTLLPKIKFFRSCGVSDAELTKIFLTAPGVFTRSLENKIMPSFKYIKSLFDSNGSSVTSLKRLADILNCDLESRLLPNIEILRGAGVPDSKIVVLLQYQPRALMVDPERFRKVVEEVKRMNFNPCGLRFVLALHAFRAVKKSTWEKKVAAYKKWGWSEDDVISAFERNPYCMMRSTDKIMAVMDFVVNKMEFDSAAVLKMPEVMSYSLEKRLKPRYLVYKTLLEKGLIEKGSLFHSTFRSTESNFLKRFVQHYEKEVPELLQLYQKALAVSKS